LEGLREEGFSEEVIEAVTALTYQHGEDYEAYILRVRLNRIARRVKLADLTDNMNLTRLPRVTPKDMTRLNKYKRAVEVLSVSKRTNTNNLNSSNDNEKRGRMS